MQSKKALAAKIKELETELKQATNPDDGLQNRLSRLRTILAKYNDKPSNFPLTGSNILAVKTYLDSGFKKMPRNTTNLFFQFLGAKLRYFSNLLEFTGDDWLELYGHRLMLQAIFNGVAVVVKNQDPGTQARIDKGIMGCVPEQVDFNGDILSAKLNSIVWFSSVSGAAKSYQLAERYNNKLIKIDDPKFTPVFLKGEAHGITFLGTLMPLLSIILKITTMLELNIPAGMFKGAYKIGGAKPDLRVVAFEIEQMMNNVNSNVLIKLDPLDARTVTEIKGNDIDHHPNEFTRQDYNWFLNLMSYLTGEFTNLSQKNERNINAEVVVNASYFKIAQMSYLREAKLFVKRYNEVYNANAEVNFTSEIEEADAYQEQSDPRAEEEGKPSSK